MPEREEVGIYKGYVIIQYGDEEGYRVDFGTKRSKIVNTLEEAHQLIDLTLKF